MWYRDCVSYILINSSDYFIVQFRYNKNNKHDRIIIEKATGRLDFQK